MASINHTASDSGGKFAKSERKKGKSWTKEEHKQFLRGLLIYGKGDWRNISRNCVKTREPSQVASHAQKYFKRLELHEKDRKRPSIHDVTIAQISTDDISSTAAIQEIPAMSSIVSANCSNFQQKTADGLLVVTQASTSSHDSAIPTQCPQMFGTDSAIPTQTQWPQMSGTSACSHQLHHHIPSCSAIPQWPIITATSYPYFNTKTCVSSYLQANFDPPFLLNSTSNESDQNSQANFDHSLPLYTTSNGSDQNSQLNFDHSLPLYTTSNEFDSFFNESDQNWLGGSKSVPPEYKRLSYFNTLPLPTHISIKRR